MGEQIGQIGPTLIDSMGRDLRQRWAAMWRPGLRHAGLCQAPAGGEDRRLVHRPRGAAHPTTAYLEYRWNKLCTKKQGGKKNMRGPTKLLLVSKSLAGQSIGQETQREHLRGKVHHNHGRIPPVVDPLKNSHTLPPDKLPKAEGGEWKKPTRVLGIIKSMAEGDLSKGDFVREIFARIQ